MIKVNLYFTCLIFLSDKFGIIFGFLTGLLWSRPRIPSQLLPQVHTSPQDVKTRT